MSGGMAGGGDAEDPWVFLDKARELNRADRHQLAREQARRGLALDPDHPFLHLEMALALDGLGDAEGAEAAARRAVELDGDGRTGALTVLGFLLMGRGRNVEAERSFLAELRTDPEHVPAWFGYAQLMYRTLRLPKARALLEQVLRLDPEHAAALRLQSAIDLQQKDDRARHGAVQSLRLEPDSAASLASLARVELASGRPFRARQHFRAALAMEPSPDYEQAWLQADRCCRWTYLPMYWFATLGRKLPGGPMALWAVMMAFMLLPRRLGVPGPLATGIGIAIGLFFLYSWIADALTGWWIRLRPPR